MGVLTRDHTGPLGYNSLCGKAMGWMVVFAGIGGRRSRSGTHRSGRAFDELREDMIHAEPDEAEVNARRGFASG